MFKLLALNRDERLALVRTEIDESREDIDAGRFTGLATDDDIHEYFEASRVRHEIKAI